MPYTSSRKGRTPEELRDVMDEGGFESRIEKDGDRYIIGGSYDRHWTSMLTPSDRMGFENEEDDYGGPLDLEFYYDGELFGAFRLDDWRALDEMFLETDLADEGPEWIILRWCFSRACKATGDDSPQAAFRATMYEISRQPGVR